MKVRVIKIGGVYFPQRRVKNIFGKWSLWRGFTYDASYLGEGEPITEVYNFKTKQEARDFLRKRGYKL